MRTRINDRLIWSMAWRVIAAVEIGVAGTSLREYVDPVDGRTLVLSAAGHEFELVLNQRRGVTVLTPILIEEVSWERMAGLSVPSFVEDLKLTLAWPRSDAESSGAALTHGVLSRLLDAMLSEPSEFWVASVAPQGIGAHQADLGPFALYKEQLVTRFEDAAVSGRALELTEAWVLYCDAAAIALFDDSAGMFFGGSRWSYAELVSEMRGDLRFVAHQLLGIIADGPKNF